MNFSFVSYDYVCARARSTPPHSVMIASHDVLLCEVSEIDAFCVLSYRWRCSPWYSSMDLGLFYSYLLSLYIDTLGLYYGCSFGSLPVVFIRKFLEN